MGLLSNCGARASCCSGFSCCRAWALGTWTSVVAARGLSSCDLLALGSADSVIAMHSLSCSEACGNLPRPRIKPMSSALAGRFSSTAPPGKSTLGFLYLHIWLFIYLEEVTEPCALGGRSVEGLQPRHRPVPWVPLHPSSLAHQGG